MLQTTFYIEQQNQQTIKTFTTSYPDILSQIDHLDPVGYGKTRNFIDGKVSYLSPYISRGVISTKQIMLSIMDKGYAFPQIEKFIQELAWRDYWQQIWIAKGKAIDADLKHPQPNVENHQMPESLLLGKTGIEAIDQALQEFYKTGYLHNHIRMYIAAMACNFGKSHWKIPAQWMYYHLLDADWASNALSWQWVAGSNSNKKYIANQENINRYCHTQQQGSFLDKSYEVLSDMPIPNALSKLILPELKTYLPESDPFVLDNTKATLLYNFYNLDPNWKAGEDVNRVLLLEPSIFDKYPVSPNTIEFIQLLALNIPNIKCYVGEFNDFVREHQPQEVCFKEHPLNFHYEGKREERDWMFPVNGYYSSFFAFWKKCKKLL